MPSGSPPTPSSLATLLSQFTASSAPVYEKHALNLLAHALSSSSLHASSTETIGDQPPSLAPTFSYLTTLLHLHPPLLPLLTTLLNTHPFPPPPPPSSSSPPLPPGITNPGKVCYVNVILTVLHSLTAFRNRVLSPAFLTSTPAATRNVVAFLTEFRTLFLTLTHTESPTVTASLLYNLLPSAGVTLTRQLPAPSPFDVAKEGDCREFFLLLMAVLSSHSSSPADLFSGSTTTTRWPVETPAETTVTAAKFTYLTVRITGDHETLAEAFAATYGDETPISGTVDAQTKTIEKEPQYLALHFARSGLSGAASPSRLSLPLPSSFRGRVLLAVIVLGGSGTADCGHVYAYVLSPSRQWVRVSDEDVEGVGGDVGGDVGGRGDVREV